MIEYKHSDLLKSDAEALVNTVNTVGVMGKGIALQFREHFNENFKIYQKACKEGTIKIGKNLLTLTGQLTGPKYIINFPTKIDWRQNTKLEYILLGLDDLVRIIKEKNIRSIAIPPLGCGNGGLDWAIVKPIMEEKLALLSDSVRIEVYVPGNHSYTRTTLKEKTPPLTKARALVLTLADRYNILGFDLSHLEIQKLAYFLQEFGQTDLNLKYAKGAYGPYATNLKHLLAYLEGYYFKGQIRFQDMKPTDGLLLVSERLDEVNRFLDENLSGEEKYRLEKVSSFIEGFESPLGLELLATVYWARKELKSLSRDDIVQYIHQWSPRKKDLMPVHQIDIALQRINASFS